MRRGHDRDRSLHEPIVIGRAIARYHVPSGAAGRAPPGRRAPATSEVVDSVADSGRRDDVQGHEVAEAERISPAACASRGRACRGPSGGCQSCRRVAAPGSCGTPSTCRSCCRVSGSAASSGGPYCPREAPRAGGACRRGFAHGPVNRRKLPPDTPGACELSCRDGSLDVTVRCRDGDWCHDEAVRDCAGGFGSRNVCRSRPPGGAAPVGERAIPGRAGPRARARARRGGRMGAACRPTTSRRSGGATCAATCSRGSRWDLRRWSGCTG